jgi:hypothetical protein
MKETIKENWWKILIGLGVFFLAYQALIGVPNKKLEAEKNEALLEAQAEGRRQYNISVCMDQAFEDYQASWASNCKAKGLKDTCSLPIALANNLDESLKDNKALCLKRY